MTHRLPPALELRGVVKDYRGHRAVDGLELRVAAGEVVALLGPNGAGKSTTMRMLIGLDRPDAGTALINGKPYRELPDPLRAVGVMLEAKAFHPARSARAHLGALAASNDIPDRRVEEVLRIVGLESVAGRRAGKFSLGMGQRLGVAAALLGDPAVLLLDEPVNGLDPEGILWIRNLLKGLAAEGRTVFVSSHLMSEMAVTATELVVVGRGRLIAAGSVEQLVGRASGGAVVVRTREADRLAAALQGPGRHIEPAGAETLNVSGMSSEAVGLVAAREGVPLIELTPVQATLEEAFMEITRDSVEFHGSAADPSAARGAQR